MFSPEARHRRRLQDAEDGPESMCLGAHRLLCCQFDDFKYIFIEMICENHQNTVS